MGKKGPLQMVEPDEFRRRTALVMSSRSGTTLKVDAAYDAYHRLRSEENAAKLHLVLKEYLQAHSGFWKNCERDKVSGGLLQWLFEFTAKAGAVAVAKPPSREEKAINDDIVHSRFGVLFLLSSIDIKVDTGQVVLTSLAQVGSAVGSGVSTDMSKLGVKDSSKAGITLMGNAITAQQLTTGTTAAVQHSKTAVDGVSMVGTKLKTAIMGTPGGPVDDRTGTEKAAGYFPCTAAALRATARMIPDEYQKTRYKNRAVQTVGAVAAGAVMSTVAFAADILYNVYQLVKKAIIAMKDMVMERIRLSKFGADLGALSKAIVKIVIDKVVSHAAPFVGPAMDIGGGLVRTIDAARNKIASWMDRKQISIVPGHPEEIAKTIESTMEMGLFKGLWDTLAGVGKMAVAVTLPGLGSLVGAVLSGIEWLVKTLWRFAEAMAIKKFLDKAKELYELEKARATRVSHATQDTGLNPLDHTTTTDVGASLIRLMPDKLEPNLTAGVIADAKKFTEFFKLGCEASPIIPMLTLNSGICGSLWTLIRMFDDAGDVIGANRPKGTTHTFDVGNNYFTRLKRFGSTYLEGSGFQFVARDPNNKYVGGLMKHVLNHRGPTTLGGQIVKFAAA